MNPSATAESGTISTSNQPLSKEELRGSMRIGAPQIIFPWPNLSLRQPFTA